jgi:hypothetical protein
MFSNIFLRVIVCVYCASAAVALCRAAEAANPIEIVGYAGIAELLFSADGSKAFSLDDRRVLKIWVVSSGRLLRTIRRPEGTSARGWFNPDYEEIELSVSADGTRILWVDHLGLDEQYDKLSLLINSGTGRYHNSI